MPQRSLTLVLISTGLTSFLSTFLAAAVNLALIQIGHEFDANPAHLSMIGSVYLLLTALCLIPFGRLSDAFGPRTTLLAGCTFFTLSNLLVPILVSNFELLVLLRAFQGIGAALLLVSNAPLIGATFPKEKRTTALGFLSGMVFFGYSIGNFAGGLLTQNYGWRSIFVFASMAGALAWICIVMFIPRTVSKKSPTETRGLDWAGLSYYALALVALQVGAMYLTSWWGWMSLSLCVLAFYLFVRRQLLASRPIFDVAMFVNNPGFAAANLTALATFTATYGSQYLLTLYLQCNRALEPLEAGRILLFQPLMQIFFSPMAGYLADRTSPLRVSNVGMVLLALALAMLSMLTQDTPMPWIYAALMLTGIGISLFAAPNASLILGSVPTERAGIATASNYVMRNLGMQLSIVGCGAALLLAVGQTNGIQPNLYPTMLTAMRETYGVFAFFCVAAVLASSRLNRLLG